MGYMLSMLLVLVVLPNLVSAQTQEECHAYNPSDRQTVSIYAAPSTQSEQVDTLQIREYRAVAFNNDLWILIDDSAGDAQGWVLGTAAYLDESCAVDWQADDMHSSAEISLSVSAVIRYSRVNLRQEPSILSVQVGQVQKGDEVILIGQSSTANGLWYLVNHANFGLVWVRSDLVTLENEQANLMVIDGNYIKAQAVVTNPAPATTTISTETDPPGPATTSGSIASGSWQHISTLDEHGCNSMGGMPVGTQTIINHNLSQAADESSITITYTNGFSFTLPLAWQRDGTFVYVGSYNEQRVRVQLTFPSSTTYSGSETVIHESGCVVRLSWVGSKL